MTSHDLDQLAALLSASPDYRVIRRLKPRDEFAPVTGNALSQGVVVDTETTGLDPRSEKIIEIGVIVFDYDATTGQVVRVTDVYSSLEDPGHGISDEITAITGITTDMVAGKKIDDERVNAMVSKASIVIAHNAQFDRPFLEKRLPVFARLAWGCTLADINWTNEKVWSRKLEAIAQAMNFFFDAHRALDDCRALLEILATPLPVSNQSALKPVLECMSLKEYKISALNSPFATKDALKSRLYKWNNDVKVWHKNCSGDQALEEEKAWLKSEIYGDRSASIAVEERDARSRFSLRPTESIKTII
jgi:DNA polymerase-3 subunit epsilon